MRKKHLSIYIILLLFASFSVFLNCSSGDTATVTIDLGFAQQESALNRSVIDRILRFFSTEAIAQEAPVNIESIIVMVTGSGMGTIEKSYPSGTTSVTIQVPAGSAREFTVLAYVDPSDPGAALSFRGTATTDLNPGDTVNLSISMIVNETKLVIPQPNSSATQKIVQITSITNPDWKELLGTDVGLPNDWDFYPWDIDFDAQGRIYIANNINSTEERVIRIDNFDTPNATIIVPDNSDLGVEVIAIDRKNNIIYHSRGADLYRTSLDGPFPDMGTPITLAPADFTNPYFVAIAVDDEGMLYLADLVEANPWAETSPDRIVKFNPNTASIINTYSTNLDFVMNLEGNWYLGDIMVKSGYVYIANSGGPDNYKIIQLSQSLAFVSGYGTNATTFPDDNQGMFYGPHHFAGIRNERFYIIDETFADSTPYDKFVIMDNMNGLNWDIFDPTTIEEDAFEFYFNC